MSRKQTPTLKDVAAAAGVSVGMASRVLGKYGSYSEDTRKRVEAAAASLRYRANGVARSLRLKRTNSVGVLVNGIATYHWTTFIQGVENAARKAGYHVVICNTDDDPERELTYLNELIEHGVDGVIASPLPENYSKFSAMDASGTAMVVVNARLPDSDLTHILSDDQGAAYEAVQYFASLGHRRIGIVAGPQTFESGRARLQGYTRALADLDIALDPDCVAYGDFRQTGGYSATSALVGLEDRPTAILVCSELMTGGALRCLKDRGLSIPRDVSLICFDDPDWASFFQPALSCVREERYNMGIMAFEALLSDFERGRTKTGAMPRSILLQSKLIQRESVRAQVPRVSGGAGETAETSIHSVDGQ